jgi:hypothetical protein
MRYFRGKGIPYALRATVKGIDPAAYARISESYREISVPTLIIWGEEDRIIRLKNGLRLSEDLTGSQLKVLDKCGHTPQEERPMRPSPPLTHSSLRKMHPLQRQFTVSTVTGIYFNKTSDRIFISTSERVQITLRFQIQSPEGSRGELWYAPFA